jgi:MSHA biogenesis protein MshQ
MTFDANGNAPFSFAHADVGRITLNASRAAGGALLSALAGSSNAFVVRPAGFTLSGIRCSSYSAGSCATSVLASPGNNPGASDVSGSAFVPAGEAFSVTVTAVDAAGNATPNYGREASPEGVRLSASLVAPAGGNAPALANPTAFGSFTSGVATGTTFAWSEAGVITLAPSVADADYLGSGNVAGSASGAVGRFYAHHLTTAVTPACGASFTYAGQPFGATVAARNAGGTALQNYAGGRFAKAVTLSDGAALGVGSLSGGAVAAAAFGAGSAAATPSYAFTDKLTAPRTLVLRATDSDGASSSGQTEGSTVLRSGRLRVAGGFGRENAALQLAVMAEYWSGASWLLNGQDSCTTLPAGAVALGNYRDAQGAATAAWTTAASAVGLAAGSGTLTLAAPSPAGSGSVELALNLGSTTAQQSCTSGLPATSGAGVAWLRSRFGACTAGFDRDPAARASFGIFAPETRRTVHAREIF